VVAAALGALAEDRGDGVLHNHGGEREEEHDDDDEGVEAGLALGEWEEPQQQALAREAAVQVRSAAAVAAAAVARPWQLPIERPPVPIVARVSLEGESTADRVESNVTAGVVDLRLRRRVARQSHRTTNLEKN